MSATIPESFGNFDLVKRVKLDFTDVTVSKWRSRTTGLSVVHLDYEGKLTKDSHRWKQITYITTFVKLPLSTDTSSLLQKSLMTPAVRTLWNKKYPYKGVLDNLANRGFSNGTNAWTDTDHTAYTISTAGEQGFLQLLPIYLDHILYPTITKAGFVTEVHHIDGKGQDSGVVYSEMQGRENTSGDLMALNAQRLINPPESAYRSETGGLMEALRVLTPEQIRRYHGTYYVPHNLSLIVAGKLSSGTLSLLDVVQKQVEPSIIEHGQGKGPRPPGWKRPFVETPSANRPTIKETIKKTVQFPERDEITYIGSVPTEHLDKFDVKLRNSFQRIVKEGIDMERMAMVLNREERQLRSKLESSKGDTFSGSIITDFLYGAVDGSDLKDSMDDIKQFDDLRSWSSELWTSLLQKYYIDTHPIVILGKPSAVLAETLEQDEKNRVSRQIEELGSEGLKKAAAELEAAKAEHDQPIPTDMLTSFPVPDVKSIAWIPVKSVQEIGAGRVSQRLASSSTDLEKYISSDGSPLPFFVQYDHVQSDFVSVHGVFSLAKLPSHLRPLISAYLSAFFSLGLKRASGEHLTHEEVINKLDDETVSYEVGLGLANSFTDTFRVSIKVETARYETAIAWLKDLIYGAEFDKDRLQIVIAKIQQSLPELKRSGDNVLGSLWAGLIYNDDSTSLAGSILPQLEFVPKLAKRLQDNPTEVIGDFEEIRKHLVDPSGVRFSVTGNVLGLEKPRSTWAKHFGKSHQAIELSPVPIASDTLSEVGKNPTKKAIVMSLPTIESSFVIHGTKGIQGFNHSDYPAIRVALEVLNATESYLWRYIRGSGLAYGAYVSLDVEAGLLTFTLYRSSNSLGAFHEAAKVVKGLVDLSIELDQTTIDAAKSSIVYGVTKNVSTPGRAAIVSFSNQALKGVSRTHQIDLLERYQAVSKEDILAALQKHVLPLFLPSSSVAVTVTAPGKAEQIGKGLQEAGFSVEQRVLEADPNEIGEDEDAESGSESGSDEEPR
ncbi:hypothetical protein C0989_002217 [Termitomyces sp. Mn162]|nr:hypothetical protein C0989_002217 [Termitomyces sp. Mn162]